MATDTHRAVERVARDSYSRLVAFLTVRSRDVAAAEDALADAFHAALETWPRTGVPDRPEAWLLTAARRRLIDHARHARVHAEAMPALIAIADEAQALASSDIVFPDERLKMLFLCAHPAIDARVRAPLMLQTVLGLDAARIASAFLVQPSAMGQRLTRAKAKIRDAGIAFELPQPAQLPPRLDAVLDAIYAAYGGGWEDMAGADPRRKGLAAEAIDLGRLLVRLMPTEPEAQGLLALMLHSAARRDARRSASGAYVPLSEQDVARWSTAMIDEAEQSLNAAAPGASSSKRRSSRYMRGAHRSATPTGKQLPCCTRGSSVLRPPSARWLATPPRLPRHAARRRGGPCSKLSRPRQSRTINPTGRSPPISSSACGDQQRPAPPIVAPSACARIQPYARSWCSRHSSSEHRRREEYAGTGGVLQPPGEEAAEI
jgi:predicted RNA polymerase sigma factor